MKGTVHPGKVVALAGVGHCELCYGTWKLGDCIVFHGQLSCGLALAFLGPIIQYFIEIMKDFL